MSHPALKHQTSVCLDAAGKWATLLLSRTKPVNDLNHGILGVECGIRSVVTATGPQTGTQCAINSGFLLISTGTHRQNTSCLEFVVFNFTRITWINPRFAYNFHPLVPSLDPTETLVFELLTLDNGSPKSRNLPVRGFQEVPRVPHHTSEMNCLRPDLQWAATVTEALTFLLYWEQLTTVNAL